MRKLTRRWTIQVDDKVGKETDEESASMAYPTGEGKLLVMSTFPRPASSQDRDGGSVP